MTKKNKTRIECSPEFKKRVKKMAAEMDLTIPEAADELIKVEKELDSKRKRDLFKIDF